MTYRRIAYIQHLMAHKIPWWWHWFRRDEVQKWQDRLALECVRRAWQESATASPARYRYRLNARAQPSHRPQLYVVSSE